MAKPMTRAQRIVLVVSGIASVVLVLFPPVETTDARIFLVFGAYVLTGVALLVAGAVSPPPPTDDPD